MLATITSSGSVTPDKENLGLVVDPPAYAIVVLPPNWVSAISPYVSPSTRLTCMSNPKISPGASVKTRNESVSGSPH